MGETKVIFVDSNTLADMAAGSTISDLALASDPDPWCSMFFVMHGFDEDEREIFEIPEAKQLVRDVVSADPVFPFLLAKSAPPNVPWIGADALLVLMAENGTTLRCPQGVVATSDQESVKAALVMVMELAIPFVGAKLPDRHATRWARQFLANNG